MEALRNEIASIILKVNGEIQTLNNARHLDADQKAENEEKIAFLEKAKEGLREAKYYIGLAN